MLKLPPIKCNLCDKDIEGDIHEIMMVRVYCDSCWNSTIRHKVMVSVLYSGGRMTTFAVVDPGEVEQAKSDLRFRYGEDVNIHVKPMSDTAAADNWVV